MKKSHNRKLGFSSILFIFFIFIGQFVFCQNQLILQNTADSTKIRKITINEDIHLDLKLITLDSGSTMKNISMYAKLCGVSNNIISVNSFNENFNIKHETDRHFSFFKTYRAGTGMRILKWDQISGVRHWTAKRSISSYSIGMIGFTTWIATLIIPPFMSFTNSGGFDIKRYLSLVGGGFVTGAAFIKISWLIGTKAGTFRINQHPNPNKLNKHEWKIVNK